MRRFHDVLISAVALVLFLPVMAVVSVAVLLESGRPVLFRQIRVGWHGKPFQILKFRSMLIGATGGSVTAGADPRITRTGRFIRRYKLDELPQLWNVLRGDMSMIGPRPEVPVFVDPQNALWKKVLSVRPGITDMASLVYRDEEWLLAGQKDPDAFYRSHILPLKLTLNVDYIDRRTPWFDLRVLLLTLISSFLPFAFDNRGFADKLDRAR